MAFNITAIMNVALASGAASKISNDLNRQLSNKKVTVDLSLANSDSIRRIKADIEGAITSVESFGRQAGLAAKRFGAFSLAAGSMIQLTSAIKQATSEAIDFDRQMVKLVQVSGDSGSAIQGVVNEVTRLSTSLGVSSKDLIQAAVTLKQANLSIDDTRVALEALAKAALAPNFENFANTTEGAIAILNQFKIGANNLESALGAVNAVAGEFAVEAGDIVEAIRKTGGAFKAAGGDLNELLGLFTSVRQTTRESAETISTGLRTIFTRIQRGNTVNALKELGVNLRYSREEALALGNANLEQQFVGPYEAIRRLSAALSALPTTDPQFAKIVEELGGYRQISKVIPLIQEFAISQKAVNVAIAGSTSLSQNAGQAQLAYAIKLQKLKEEFNALIRSITQSTGFQKLFDTFISGASAAIQLADALKPLIPLIGAIATVKVATGIGQFVKGFSTGITASPNPKIFNQNRFADGGIVRMKRGGVVPGSGSGDIVPALLEPGELVIPKKYAKGGTIDLETYQTSGILTNVIQVALGQRKNSPKLQRKENSSQSFIKGKTNYIFSAKDKNGKPIKQEVEIQDSNIPTFIYNPTVKYKNKNVLLSEKIQLEAKKIIKNNENTIKIQSLKDTYGELRGREIAKAILNKSNASQLEGYLFEHEVKNTEKLKDASLTDANFPIDFSGSYNQIKQLPGLEDLVKISNKRNLFVETKRSVVSGNEILDKEVNLFKEQIKNILYKDKQPEEISFKRIKEKNKASGGFIVPGSGNSDSVPMDLDEGSFVIRKSSVAKIGADNLMNMSRKGFAKGGRVPAILTPGEFVFSPSAASSIGGANLDRMNKFGKFALGGRVGLANGGQPEREMVIPQQRGLIFRNKTYNLETLINSTKSLADAEKALADIIYAQISATRVDLSQSQALSQSRAMAASTLKLLEDQDRKILTATSALATARASATSATDPSVIQAQTRLDELKKERQKTITSLTASALPTGEQSYTFKPATKVTPLAGKETVAGILEERAISRFEKVTKDPKQQALLGTTTKQRFLAEEENKLRNQIIVAISEQLRILTGINDNEILIETATQKYSQAIQQNANIVVKQGRVFGLESLEKDIKAGTVKVNDNLRGVADDLKISKGPLNRAIISVSNSFSSLKSAITDFTNEVKTNGLFSGLTQTKVGRSLTAVGAIGSIYGGEAASAMAGTAEQVVSGQISKTRYQTFSALGSAITDATTAAAIAAPTMNPLVIGIAAVGAGVIGLTKQFFNASKEIEKIRIDKAVDKINQSVSDLVSNKEYIPTAGVETTELSSFVKNYRKERQALVSLNESLDPEQLKNELKGKFSGSLQGATQIIQDRLRSVLGNQKINAAELFQTFRISPINADLINLLGDASGKAGEELNKLILALARSVVDEQRVEQVRQSSINAANRFSSSLEFLSNSVESAISKFEELSNSTIYVTDILSRSAEFRTPDIKSRVKLGSDQATFSNAIKQVFSPFGEQAKPQIEQAQVLNQFLTELPSVLAVIKSQGGLEGANFNDQLEKLLAGRGIDVQQGTGRDLLQVVQDYLERNQASLTRRGAAFDPTKAAKEALQSQIQEFQSVANSTSEAITKVGQAYINGLAKISQEQNRYLSELQKVSDATANLAKLQAELQASRTGLPVSNFLNRQDILRPLVERQTNLGVPAQNALNPQAIYNDLVSAQKEVISTGKDLESSFVNLASGNIAQKEAARLLAQKHQEAKDKAANLADALANLRDETTRSTEAQSRLTEAEQQREAKLNAARTLLTADRKQLREIERGRGIAEQVNAGADIMSFSLKARKQFATFTDTFRNVRLPEFGGITGEEIQNRALAKGFPQLNIKTEQDKADQARQDLVAIAADQVKAAELYAKFIKDNAQSTDKLKQIGDQFLSSLERIFTQEIQRKQKVEEIQKEDNLIRLRQAQGARLTLESQKTVGGKTFADLLKGSTAQEERDRIVSAKGIFEKAGTLEEDLRILSKDVTASNLLTDLKKGDFRGANTTGLSPEAKAAFERIKSISSGGGIGAENVRNELVKSFLSDKNLLQQEGGVTKKINELSNAANILAESSVKQPLSTDALTSEIKSLIVELMSLRKALYNPAEASAKNVGTAFGLRTSGGLRFRGYNKGGKVEGIGDTDSELALLTPGEYVVPKNAYKKNGGLIRYLSEGGSVESELKTLQEIYQNQEKYRKINTQEYLTGNKEIALEKFIRDNFSKKYQYSSGIGLKHISFSNEIKSATAGTFDREGGVLNINLGARGGISSAWEFFQTIDHESAHAADYNPYTKKYRSETIDFNKNSQLRNLRKIMIEAAEKRVNLVNYDRVETSNFINSLLGHDDYRKAAGLGSISANTASKLNLSLEQKKALYKAYLTSNRELFARLMAGDDTAIAGGYGPKEIAKIFSQFPEFRNLINEKPFLSASDFPEIKFDKDIAEKIKPYISKDERAERRRRIQASNEGYRESDTRSGTKRDRAEKFERIRNPKPKKQDFLYEWLKQKAFTREKIYSLFGRKKDNIPETNKNWESFKKYIDKKESPNLLGKVGKFARPLFGMGGSALIGGLLAGHYFDAPYASALGSAEGLGLSYLLRNAQVSTIGKGLYNFGSRSIQGLMGLGSGSLKLMEGLNLKGNIGTPLTNFANTALEKTFSFGGKGIETLDKYLFGNQQQLQAESFKNVRDAVTGRFTSPSKAFQTYEKTQEALRQGQKPPTAPVYRLSNGQIINPNELKPGRAQIVGNKFIQSLKSPTVAMAGLFSGITAAQEAGAGRKGFFESAKESILPTAGAMAGFAVAPRAIASSAAPINFMSKLFGGSGLIGNRTALAASQKFIGGLGSSFAIGNVISDIFTGKRGREISGIFGGSSYSANTQLNTLNDLSAKAAGGDKKAADQLELLKKYGSAQTQLKGELTGPTGFNLIPGIGIATELLGTNKTKGFGYYNFFDYSQAFTNQQSAKTGEFGSGKLFKSIAEGAIGSSTATTTAGIWKDKIISETIGTGLNFGELSLGGITKFASKRVLGLISAAGAISRLILTIWTAKSEAELNKNMKDKREALLSLQSKLPTRFGNNKISYDDFDKIPDNKWSTLADLDFLYETGAAGADQSELSTLDNNKDFSFPAAREYERLRRSMIYSGIRPGKTSSYLKRADQVFSAISQNASNKNVMTDAILRASEAIYGPRGEIIGGKDGAEATLEQGQKLGTKLNEERLKQIEQEAKFVDDLMDSFTFNWRDNLAYLSQNLRVGNIANIFSSITGVDPLKDIDYIENARFTFADKLFRQQHEGTFSWGNYNKREYFARRERTGLDDQINALKSKAEKGDDKAKTKLDELLAKEGYVSYQGATTEQTDKFIKSFFALNEYQKFFKIRQDDQGNYIKNDIGYILDRILPFQPKERVAPVHKLSDTPINEQINKALEEIDSKQKLNYKNSGGMIPTMLTPGEAVIPPEIAKSNRGLLESINSGVNYKQDGGSLSLVKSSGKSHPLRKGPDTEFHLLEPESFVVNKTATERNMGLLQSLSSGGSVRYLAEGGVVNDNDRQNRAWDAYRTTKDRYKKSPENGMTRNMWSDSPQVITENELKDRNQILLTAINPEIKLSPEAQEAKDFIDNFEKTNILDVLGGAIAAGQNAVNQVMAKGQSLSKNFAKFQQAQAIKPPEYKNPKLLFDNELNKKYQESLNYDQQIKNSFPDFDSSALIKSFPRYKDNVYYKNEMDDRDKIIEKSGEIWGKVFIAEQVGRAKQEAIDKERRDKFKSNRYSSIVTDLINRPRKSDKNKNEKTKQFEDYIDANTAKIIADEKNRPDKFKDRKDIDKSYFSGITKLNATPIPENIRNAVVNIAKIKNIKGFSGGNGEFKNVTDFGEIHKLLGNSTVFLRSTDLDTIEDVLSKETKNRYGIATQGSGGDIISGEVYKEQLFDAKGNIAGMKKTPSFLSKHTLADLIKLYPNLESSLIDYDNIFDQEQLDKLLKKQVNIKPRGFNFGGYVNGAGSGDIIPAYLSAGEFVMNRGAVQEYGYDMLNAMNAKRMYEGGPSDGSPSLFDNVAKSSVNLDSIDTGSFADSVKLFNRGSDKFKQSIDKMGETITRLQSAVNDLAKINIPEEITGNITVENNANVKIDSPNFAGEVNSIVGKAVTNIAKALENTTGGAITQSDLFRDLGTELG
jgi:TP901 family phage tail tape measure protein